MIKIFLKNEKETKKIGYNLGKVVKGGCTICLIGDLGAGKTTFAQSFAYGLGVGDYVTSPTFTIVNEYNGRLKMYHFDAYRIGDSNEMNDIGYDEYINSDGVCLIEWANLIEDILPEDYIKIEFRYLDNGREMFVSQVGNKYDGVIEEMFNNDDFGC